MQHALLVADMELEVFSTIALIADIIQFLFQLFQN